MEVSDIKKLLDQLSRKHWEKIQMMHKAENYYLNKTDILNKRNELADSFDFKNPLRNADNRIPHNFFSILVDQKSAYTFTEPPRFDVDHEEVNHKINVLLGDQFAKISKELCTQASLNGIAWLHVWKDERNNFFKYATVPAEQIIPIYSGKLDNELEAVIRVYTDTDDRIIEYWTSESCTTFRQRKDSEQVETFAMFTLVDIATGMTTPTNEYRHEWGEIPFIPFRNNSYEVSDLDSVKDLIDVYDKVFSGFVNDADDIQEIIFVLTNYGGEDRKMFLDDLKQSKIIKIDDDGTGASGGVDTITLDIPTEARRTLLEMTREAIFTHGQGVDPQRNIGQNHSGAALRYMYSLLDLKASRLETEFRVGFAKLIRFILTYYNLDPDVLVKQTWTRSFVNNTLEQAQVLSITAPYTSTETIAKNNPLVDDWQNEVKQIEQDKIKDMRALDDYSRRLDE